MASYQYASKVEKQNYQTNKLYVPPDQHLNLLFIPSFNFFLNAFLIVTFAYRLYAILLAYSKTCTFHSITIHTDKHRNWGIYAGKGGWVREIYIQNFFAWGIKVSSCINPFSPKFIYKKLYKILTPNSRLQRKIQIIVRNFDSKQLVFNSKKLKKRK